MHSKIRTIGKIELLLLRIEYINRTYYIIKIEYMKMEYIIITYYSYSYFHYF